MTAAHASIEMINIDDIVIDEQGLREDPNDEAIVELAQDIRKRGLLQPIGVSRRPDGKYQLRWGGRRLAAHKRLGRKKIEARIYEMPDESVKATALVENIQRVNLSLKEECDAVTYLHQHEGRSPDSIANLLSKSRAWVMRRLTIPNLPQEVAAAVLDGSIPISVGEELAKVEDEGARNYILSTAIYAKYSLSEVRAAIEAYRQTIAMEDAVESGLQESQRIEQRGERLERCAACGAMRPIQQLHIIKVCYDGCIETRKERNGAN